jgi:hypothetical protein
MTGTQLFRPRLICIHDRVVKTDWKQDCPTPLALLLEGCGHLVFDPIAFNRMLRQNQYEVVPIGWTGIGVC